MEISQELKNKLSEKMSHFESGGREKFEQKDVDIKTVSTNVQKYNLRTVKHTCFEVLRVFEVDVPSIKCYYCEEVV